MAHRVFPCWLGWLLANPWRRWVQNPAGIVAPFVSEGMTVLEVGPGFGYFTIELARLVGTTGRVVAIDVQPQMLAGLGRRARRAGLLDRVEMRVPEGRHLGVRAFQGAIDFALAFAVVHEVQDQEVLFEDLHGALKPGGRLLIAEAVGHVALGEFAETLRVAGGAGFRVVSQPFIRGNRTALLAQE